MAYPTAQTPGGVAPAEDPTVNPIEYLSRVWDAFVDLGPQIRQLQHRAARAVQSARAVGLEGLADRGVEVIQDLGDLAQIHARTVERVRQYGEYLGLGSLGAVPVYVASALAALALVVAWVIRRYEYHRDLVAAIEAGTLTVDDLRVLNEHGPAPTDVLGRGLQLGTVALVLIGGLLLLRALDAFNGGGFSGNPRLSTWHPNPDDGALIGERVYAVAYRHAQDSSLRYHDFGPHVRLIGRPDGTAVLTHTRGRRVWRDFR